MDGTAPEIIEKIRTGDRKVIKQLYEEAFHYCASFILKNGGQTEDARDVFQEALMVLVRQCNKADFQLHCEPKTYLYSVMRYIWFNQRKKDKNTGLRLHLDGEEAKEVVAIEDGDLQVKKENEEKYSLMQEAIKHITGECRQLLLDFYFKKIDLKSIAEKMNYTYSFVKVKKNRCMNALKKQVRNLSNQQNM